MVDSNRMSMISLVQAFQGEGWEINGQITKFVCPDCVRKRSAPRPTFTQPVAAPASPLPEAISVRNYELGGQSKMAQALQPVAKAEEPRKSTASDRKEIADRIESVWVTGAECYAGSCSDAKLATEMNVPRAWVTAVREFAFGPEDRNEEASAASKEIKALRAILAQAEALVTSALERTAECKARIDAFERKPGGK